MRACVYDNVLLSVGVCVLQGRGTVSRAFVVSVRSRNSKPSGGKQLIEVKMAIRKWAVK